MDGAEAIDEGIVHVVEVMKVADGILLASDAIAVLGNGAGVFAMFFVLEIEEFIPIVFEACFLSEGV